MCLPDKGVSTGLCLKKHYNCFLVILPNFPKQIFESEMYFHVPVCADLIRVFNSICMCLGKHYNCFLVILPNFPKQIIESKMYFNIHVPVCADLIRVLAHACAWETLQLFPCDSA